MDYRVGMPGWRLAARLGARLCVRVDVHFDPETKSYWAESPDLRGLVVTGKTFEELRDETVAAASSLLEIACGGKDHHAARVSMRDEIAVPCAA